MSVKPVAWTPGPWHVLPNDGAYVGNDMAAYRIETAPGSPRDLCVALVITDTPELATGMGKANAELFAAAPELAEALQELTTRIIDCAGDCPHSVVTLAHGAILLLARITPK